MVPGNIRIEWRGPTRLKSGLGRSSREYVKALKGQGFKVRDGQDRRSRRAASGPRVLIFHYPPHRLNMDRARRRYARIILNTVWETTRIPFRWRKAINRYDAVFVPSRHNIKAMRRSGVRVPVYLTPHGVNTDAFRPSNRPTPLPGSKGRFVFLSVFGFQHRKNPEALLRAYWEEFTSKDKVLLVIKTNGYGGKDGGVQIRQRIERYKASLSLRHQTAPLVLLTGHLKENELKGLYTAADCFVLPTRGEGVGMPFMEALASGIPVIATAWGGQMDFLTRSNSFLVPYRLQNPAFGMKGSSAISKPFKYLFNERDQQWAEADGRELKRLMRMASRNPALCKRKGLLGRQAMLGMGWRQSGSAMGKAVKKVLAGRSSSSIRR